MDNFGHILYLAPIDWHFIRQRPQQLALLLSKNHRLIYTSPRTIFGMRKLKKQGGISSLRKALRVERINERLVVFAPQILPEHNFVSLKKFNQILFRFQIQRFIQKNEIEISVLWIGHPRFAYFVDIFKRSLVCYDCMDNWAEFSYAPRVKELIQSQEVYLISKAHIVFTSSLFLFERIQKNKKEVYLIPNGVDIEHFSKAVRYHLPTPQDIEDLKKPLIGYIGAVAEWLDLELITFLAEKRRDYNFVFIGPIESAGISNSLRLSNVYFLGFKPYESLPAYLQHIDIFILPFKIGRLSQSVDPVKAYEYLAAGREIVATHMPELYKFKDLIKIAKSKEEFLELLTDVIRNLETGKLEAQAKLEAVRDHSWENRVEKIERHIEAYLKI